MTAIRIVSCPQRMAGETGQAFIERMLRDLGSKTNGHRQPKPQPIPYRPG
jgi:hypothetical protein